MMSMMLPTSPRFGLFFAREKSLLGLNGWMLVLDIEKRLTAP
jgi:hypothetical protein